MFGIFKFGAGVVTGGVMAIGGMNYHVVRTEDGVTLVPKLHATIDDVYLDIRDWTLSDWKNHSDFVVALEKNDRRDLIPLVNGKLASLKSLIE